MQDSSLQNLIREISGKSRIHAQPLQPNSEMASEDILNKAPSNIFFKVQHISSYIHFHTSDRMHRTTCTYALVKYKTQ